MKSWRTLVDRILLRCVVNCSCTTHVRCGYWNLRPNVANGIKRLHWHRTEPAWRVARCVARGVARHRSFGSIVAQVAEISLGPTRDIRRKYEPRSMSMRVT